ncbi:hypothetical protein YC2023_065462 [Brassica napus]
MLCPNVRKFDLKTLGNLLGKSSNAFYARRLPMKFSRSLMKFYPQSGTNFAYSDFGKLHRRLLEDSRKTLGRLLGKSSNAFYARRLPTKSSGSLPKSYIKSGENSKKLGFQFKSVRDKGIVKLCGVIDQNFERDELLDFGVD